MTNTLKMASRPTPTVTRFLAILFSLMYSGTGCSLPENWVNQPVKTNKRATTELVSNLENTSFYWREWKLGADPYEGWNDAGIGRRVKVDLFEGGRYDIKATHQGCKDKNLRLSEPIDRFTFKFVDADRINGPPPPEPRVQRPVRPPVVPPAPIRPTPRPAWGTATPVRARWAVVIGVSDYKDHRIPNLRYAARDAESFYGWLTSSRGGKYAPVNTKLLVDKRATGQAIKDALFDWLGQALEEDLVTIYFSGHGTPESPDVGENLVLLPHDADYDRIAATGFPMWDIKQALKRFIKARKVVVIADACHAGGVGSEFADARRAIGPAQAGKVSQGLQGLAQVNDGVAIITSAGANQLSQESEKWGGGHGVFTHFLLEGLRGQADVPPRDGRVNLGELTNYVSWNVRAATKNAQSPEVAGKYDPALTLADYPSR